MVHQLPLPLKLDPEFSFDHFIPGGNSEVVSYLKMNARGEGYQQIYLHGGEGIGKSHLLRACATACTQAMRSSIILDLANQTSMTPEILEGLSQLDLICLDNVERISGDRAWEMALFALYHEIEDSAARMVLSSRLAPEALRFELEDLKSRMQSGLIFKLHLLDEDETIKALIVRAGSIGLHLSFPAAGYLMRHSKRDLGSQIRLLDQLDQASLANQRKLTVPFIKKVLGEMS